MAQTSRGVKIGNTVIKALNNMGLKMGPIVVLTVVGRKSGVLRSTPVTTVTVDDSVYIVAGITGSQWAQNLRAAGVGSIQRGRSHTKAAFPEITDPEQKRHIVVEYGLHAGRGGQYLVQQGAAPDRTPEGLAQAVPHVGIFRIDHQA
jgi:deazaflavin-dependent oxidoreductase (nitroreductase family)